MAVIDLNADLGEGFGRWSLTDDVALLDVVTSANIACGFHAGDPSIMRRVCELAVARGVTIGAQVSYRDLAGFGRRSMEVPLGELAAEVAYQIGALEVFARAAGTRVAYVKPHGALYNRTVMDEAQAAAVVEGTMLASTAVGASLPLMGLPGSALLKAAADAGLAAVEEAFADRAYHDDGTLVPRSEPEAVVDDPDVVVARALAMVAGESIATVSGGSLSVAARSICVHGDTPGAAALAARIREELLGAGHDLDPFAAPPWE
ncbi:5-oxoprolinase subunit PxpA [Demequina sp. SYSU T00039]|uniref:5-oxoprolinase subunit A n=1 Tax=Demequina lignilytica TaxID=3051663 RepID=A0AAW7M7A8_9MICO|nr:MULTISPECIES: 5-oxoprolinase subunit PxpA [unclassified Demequina]MDN4478678.1 5-oxoprolinase subunit PxpA [Demequina sp. SYSU T00039-1]MDN4488656.1 5-oxoprolinase subunit PxpA [Demequina sp. SYSU T00039]MDN4491888.1 5-oxoprolinase subunit PxpA [Demequina sp. SYSU T00068]